MKALLLSILVACAALPAAAGDAKPISAIFLVARADLPDPNFKDSVVVVTNQGPAGPLGLIINKATEIALAQVFSDVEAIADLPAKIFFGGPVAVEMLTFLVRGTKPPEPEAIELVEGVYLSQDPDVLRELLKRKNPTEGLRVFAGYSGWMPGQLESEISRGGWHVLPADAKAIFDPKPERLWPELNRKASSVPVRLSSSP